MTLSRGRVDGGHARAAVRPQRRSDVEAALGRIREAGIPVLNIDLIYGIEGQDASSWRLSLDAALRWRPEEIYLYPLYVRPLTGLDRHADPLAREQEWDSERLVRRGDAPPQGPDDYACQTDGMIGLGCGARSYTSALHYSFDYAVSAREVRATIDTYTATTDFDHAAVGRAIDADEARRRHLLQSLLQAQGLRIADYRLRFGADPREDFPEQLGILADRGWLADGDSGRLRLSPRGLAYSDAIGPEFFSPAVRSAMSDYELR